MHQYLVFQKKKNPYAFVKSSAFISINKSDSLTHSVLRRRTVSDEFGWTEAPLVSHIRREQQSIKRELLKVGTGASFCLPKSLALLLLNEIHQ